LVRLTIGKKVQKEAEALIFGAPLGGHVDGD
jgi:hypothetical protein